MHALRICTCHHVTRHLSGEGIIFLLLNDDIIHLTFASLVFICIFSFILVIHSFSSLLFQLLLLLYDFWIFFCSLNHVYGEAWIFILMRLFGIDWTGVSSVLYFLYVGSCILMSIGYNCLATNNSKTSCI